MYRTLTVDIPLPWRIIILVVMSMLQYSAGSCRCMLWWCWMRISECGEHSQALPSHPLYTSPISLSHQDVGGRLPSEEVCLTIQPCEAPASLSSTSVSVVRLRWILPSAPTCSVGNIAIQLLMHGTHRRPERTSGGNEREHESAYLLT